MPLYPIKKQVAKQSFNKVKLQFCSFYCEYEKEQNIFWEIVSSSTSLLVLHEQQRELQTRVLHHFIDLFSFGDSFMLTFCDDDL